MTQYLKRKQKQSGFTLVELLVVIAIIGILTAIGIPMYSGYQTAAKVSATKQNYDSMKSYFAGEITKCSAGLVPSLAQAGAVSGPACNPMVATPGTLADYFVAYAVQTIKNPYSTSAVQAVAAPSPGTKAAQADAGKLFVDATLSTCTGLAVSTVIQDTSVSGSTPTYVSYPTTPECISVQ